MDAASGTDATINDQDKSTMNAATISVGNDAASHPV
jgi:hypothetical protein